MLLMVGRSGTWKKQDLYLKGGIDMADGLGGHCSVSYDSAASFWLKLIS